MEKPDRYSRKIYPKSAPRCATPKQSGRPSRRSRAHKPRDRGDTMKDSKGQSWDSKSMYKAWAAACFGLALEHDCKESARRAIILDILFPVADVVHRWIDKCSSGGAKPDVFGEVRIPDGSVSERVLLAVKQCGFEGSLGSKTGSSGELARLLFDPDALEQLQIEIYSAEKLSPRWAQRFIVAGVRPEIRAFDLRDGSELRLGFAETGRGGGPILETDLAKDALTATIRGWNGHGGREASCALLPRGIESDEVFTCHLKVPFPPTGKNAVKRPRASTKAWKALMASPEGRSALTCSTVVEEGGVLICQFRGETGASEVAEKLLVIALLS